MFLFYIVNKNNDIKFCMNIFVYIVCINLLIRILVFLYVLVCYSVIYYMFME